MRLKMGESKGIDVWVSAYTIRTFRYCWPRIFMKLVMADGYQ